MALSNRLHGRVSCHEYRSTASALMNPGPIDRATAEDVVSLATDVGPAPMQVGAVLVLDAATLDIGQTKAAIAERISVIPRLRKLLVHTPPGCGRPVWIDDADFELDNHVDFLVCPTPGGEAELLAVAATAIGTRLPPGRPLWRMVIVSGLNGPRVALVVAFHHVLADGIGGLAVLANLVDGASTGHAADFPRPAPSAATLAADSARARLCSFARLPSTAGRLGATFRQIRSASKGRAERCSLNSPTGARRRFRVARVDLDAIHRAAHANCTTINDVVLSAATSALNKLLLSRGDPVRSFVVSVPVSARTETNATELGNQVGVIRLELPATGDPFERLHTISVATRTGKLTAPTESAAFVGSLFRTLGRLGVFRWFINRQRLVHTFTTNLRGPDTLLHFLGEPIIDVIPVAIVTGNVTVSFAALSYCGKLVITVIADPEACPDLDLLADAFQNDLDHLVASFDRDTTPHVSSHEIR